MSWTIWQTLKNTAVIQDETKKEVYKEIIKDLKNFSPLSYNFTINDLIKKYEELLKKLE